jgi:hypothetical protein
MFQKASHPLFVLLLAVLPRMTQAQTIIDNGGQNTINGLSGTIELEGNGTTLNVVSPAMIVGISTPQPYATLNGDSGTTINLLGGQVIGPMNGFYPGTPGIEGQIGSNFFASGGFAQGGTNGSGLQLMGTSQITGGTFQGTTNGHGADFYGGTAQISGGTFQGAGNGFGAEFLDSGNRGSVNVFNITGGLFNGGNAGAHGEGGGGVDLLFVNGGSATISGGTFIGGTGGQGNGDSLRLDLRQLSGNPVSQVDVTGGVFSGGIDVFLSGSYLNFYGSNFAYNYVTGEFTGTLEDGNNIDVTLLPEVGTLIYSANAAAGEARFTQVNTTSPEPSSVLMLAVGVLGLAAAKHYQSGRVRRNTGS